MDRITTLESYSDDRGNTIVYEGEPIAKPVSIAFKGSNNTLVVSSPVKVGHLKVTFVGDGGRAEIQESVSHHAGLKFELRVGHSSTITIGRHVGCQGVAFVSAVEGADVTIGADCMLSTDIDLRTDDSHPIYDVRTQKRVNKSESITIGEHVWLGKYVTVMGGVRIGTGSVIGWRSLVTKDVPNNCVAVGTPARVARRDIAWERPMVVDRLPEEETPRPGEKHEQYWSLTRGGEPAVVPAKTARARAATRRRVGRFVPAGLRPPLARFVHRVEVTVSRVGRSLRRPR